MTWDLLTFLDFTENSILMHFIGFRIKIAFPKLFEDCLDLQILECTSCTRLYSFYSY